MMYPTNRDATKGLDFIQVFTSSQMALMGGIYGAVRLIVGIFAFSKNGAGYAPFNREH